ncbi:MAG TPA: hypothetical protein PK683_22675, partial [Leptospiraceae bacterium]|nr:hypothetical protein [Leptospiraceae bacterium]
MKRTLLKIKSGFLIGVGIALGFATVTILAVAVGNINTFTSGTPVNAAKVNENFASLKTVLENINDPPIGSIVAWHENLSGVPSLPSGWVRCNGQTLSDSLSPLNGQVIPNLNTPKNAWNSKGSFLRGSATSGVFEDDSFQGHWHNAYWATGATGPGYDIPVLGTGGSGGVHQNRFAQTPIDDGANGSPRTASETRSVNMSV